MRRVFILIMMLTCSILHAQDSQREIYNRYSFWTETVFNGGIQNRWKWQLDYQYRRMSDASDMKHASANPFKYAFQHVYRPWIHYQLSEGVRFSLSPLGFWETNTPSNEGSGSKQIQPEFRTCPQLTLANKIGRIAFDQRYRFEFRFFGEKVSNTQGGEFGYGQGFDFPQTNRKMRLRYFVRALMPLGRHLELEENTFYVVAWNELFLGLGSNTNNDKFWDQNRTFCLLGYKPAMEFPMRFELGYGVQYANKFSSSYDSATGVLTETGHKIERNNILQVYVIFEDFNSLFKRAKV